MCGVCFCVRTEWLRGRGVTEKVEAAQVAQRESGRRVWGGSWAGSLWSWVGRGFSTLPESSLRDES